MRLFLLKKMGFSFKTKNLSIEFGKKSRQLQRDDSNAITGFQRDLIFDIASPYVASDNFITLFETIPEISFPIRYLIDKILNGNFLLKKQRDDSVVWNNKQINKFLTRPNSLYTFNEFVAMHFAYKFLTGNSYIRAAVPSSLSSMGKLWERCDDYWVLPANCVNVVPVSPTPLFSSARKEEMIESYQLSYGGIVERFKPENILHVKELNVNSDMNLLEGRSRLISQIKPISNLIAVYEARNIIYLKRGALGIIVSRKKDEGGSVALEDKEKEELRKEYERTYGLGKDQSTVAILKSDVDFIKTSMSIQELEPFEETLLDAVSIAGAFSIPSQLIPRKDNSTYNNQLSSERGVYNNIIIPEAKAFVRDLTHFLELDKSNLYLDVDYSEVDALQAGYKERQQTRSIMTTTCKTEFMSGIITLNDWRARVGESRVDNVLYDKLILEMTDEELNKIKTIISNGTVQGNTVQNQNQ